MRDSSPRARQGRSAGVLGGSALLGSSGSARSDPLPTVSPSLSTPSLLTPSKNPALIGTEKRPMDISPVQEGLDRLFLTHRPQTYHPVGFAATSQNAGFVTVKNRAVVHKDLDRLF